VDLLEKMKTVKITNENTSLSEEMKVGLADEAIAIVSSGQKKSSKEKREVL